jgi:hypothetical protein
MNLNRLNYIIPILSYILNKLFRRLNKGCVLLFIFLLKHIALLLLHLFIFPLFFEFKSINTYIYNYLNFKHINSQKV